MTIWKESEIAQLTHNWRKYTSADSHREFEKKRYATLERRYAGIERRYAGKIKALQVK